MTVSRITKTFLYSIVTLMYLVSCPIFVVAATINVPSDVSTIQGAIDIAYVNDTILVAPGIYVENLVYKLKAIYVISSDGPEITIIESADDSKYIADIVSIKGDTTAFCGFTIRHSRRYQTIRIDNNGAVAKVNNCIFYDNLTINFESRGESAVIQICIPPIGWVYSRFI